MCLINRDRARRKKKICEYVGLTPLRGRRSRRCPDRRHGWKTNSSAVIDNGDLIMASNVRKDITSQEQDVISLLRRAFPRKESAVSVLSHDECIELRDRLIAVESVEMPFYLAQVLEDLILYPPRRAGDSGNAEAVIQFLDVLAEGVDFGLIAPHYDGDELAWIKESEGIFREEKAECFSRFSSLQASAISRWLQIAHSWEGLSWYHKEIDNAIEYWKGREDGFA